MASNRAGLLRVVLTVILLTWTRLRGFLRIPGRFHDRSTFRRVNNYRQLFPAISRQLIYFSGSTICVPRSPVLYSPGTPAIRSFPAQRELVRLGTMYLCRCGRRYESVTSSLSRRDLNEPIVRPRSVSVTALTDLFKRFNTWWICV